jgi:hypothetical protein
MELIISLEFLKINSYTDSEYPFTLKLQIVNGIITQEIPTVPFAIERTLMALLRKGSGWNTES